MGTDIHDFIMKKDGTIVTRDIFKGRDSEWFDSLQHRGYCDEIYSYFPNSFGVPDIFKEKYSNEMEDCYGFGYLTIEEFRLWYYTYKPYLDAGWVDTYNKWLYETKTIEPELLHHLPEDANIHDMYFIEVIKNYWAERFWIEKINGLLNKGLIEDDDYLIYFFDC